MRAIQSVFGTISFNLDMHYDTVIMTLVEHNYIAYLGGDDYVYYFAHKGKRRTVEKSEYSRGGGNTGAIKKVEWTIIQLFTL